MLPTSFLVLCLVLFLSSPPFIVKGDTECPVVSSSGDRRTNKNSLRIVQYNVEWLFVDYNSNAKCPGTGCPWTTTDNAKTHLSLSISNISDEIHLKAYSIISIPPSSTNDC